MLLHGSLPEDEQTASLFGDSIINAEQQLVTYLHAKNFDAFADYFVIDKNFITSFHVIFKTDYTYSFYFLLVCSDINSQSPGSEHGRVLGSEGKYLIA